MSNIIRGSDVLEAVITTRDSTFDNWQLGDIVPQWRTEEHVRTDYYLNGEKITKEEAEA